MLGVSPPCKSWVDLRMKLELQNSREVVCIGGEVDSVPQSAPPRACGCSGNVERRGFTHRIVASADGSGAGPALGGCSRAPSGGGR